MWSLRAIDTFPILVTADLTNAQQTPIRSVGLARLAETGAAVLQIGGADADIAEQLQPCVQSE